MGLRAKFLLILITFSVVPLISYFLIHQKLFDKLGDEVYQIAKVLLLQTTAKELQESADNYTRNINRELTHTVRRLERCRDEIVSLENRPLSIQKNIAEQMEICSRTTEALDIDLISVNFFSKRDVHFSFFTEGIPALTIPPFQKTSTPLPENSFWLSSGMTQLPTLGKNHITASLPVRNTNGSMLGYLAIDFNIIKLLETLRPPSQWSPYMQSLLLQINHQEIKNNNSFVIGSRNPQSENTSWTDKTFLLQQNVNVNDALVALLEGNKYGQQGYVSAPYEGELSVLAYSETKIGLGILNVLPEREVIYKIARHPQRLNNWLSLDSLLLVSIVVVLMIIIVFYRSRHMLAPFFSIISAFRRLSDGDFSTKLEFNAQDERQMVAEAFNNMALQLKDSIRMRQGLEVAKEVQHYFFPEVDPTISELDIVTRMNYCEETGGDYVDVLRGKNGEIYIVVGDVTGHGIGAALLMITVRTLIRERYEIDTTLSELITSVNSKLTADMGESGRFITLFAMEINPAAMELKWVRAGHDPGWLFCSTDNSIVSLIGPGIALGVDPDFIYSANNRDQLESGDVIIIGTDGIWETINTEEQQFGKHRLEQIVSQNLTRSATEISDSLIAAVSQFRGTQNPEDDVSLVVIKVPEQ